MNKAAQTQPPAADQAAHTSTPLSLALYRSNNPVGYQLAIEDASGGYRLAGPKFNGQGQLLQRRELTERDAEQIRIYLERRFPIMEGIKAIARAPLVEALETAQSALEAAQVFTSPLQKLSWDEYKQDAAERCKVALQQARAALAQANG